MDLALLHSFLLWCAAINYGILLVWFLVFTLAHDWVYRLHSRWFRLSPEMFDALTTPASRCTRSASCCSCWCRCWS
jgi:hypothetical protein